MPVHTSAKITYNPLQSKVYTHVISPTQVEITITGEDIQISGVRLRPLNHDLTEVEGTEEVTATL